MSKKKFKQITAATLCALTTLTSFAPAFAADATTSLSNVANDSYIVSLKLATTKTGNELGDATLAGITYQLMSGNATNDELLATGTADKEGQINFVLNQTNANNLTTNKTTAYVKETTAQTTGFEKSDTKTNVDASAIDGAVSVDTDTTAENYLKKYGFSKDNSTNVKYVKMGDITRDDIIKNEGSISVSYKASDLDEATTIKNVGVKVYRKADIANINSSTPVTEGKTDAKGVYQFTALPYGEYVAVIDSYESNGNSIASTTSNFAIVSSSTTDAVKLETIGTNSSQAYIKVAKKDADTGKPVKMANTTFQILDSNKNPITIDGKTEFVTDENGEFTSSLRLPYGDYYLKETKAPEGYNIAPLTAFTISVDTLKESKDLLPDDVVNTMYVVLNDEAQTGSLTVNVKTNTLTSIAHDDATDTYSLIYTDAPVAGVSYTLVAADNIVLGDGTVKYKKGEVAAKQESDKDGKIAFTDIALGTYFLFPSTEVDSDGLTTEKVDEILNDKDSTVTKIELVYDATAANQTEKTQDIVLADAKATVTRTTASLSFEVNLADGTEDDYASMVYGLFAAEEIVAADGKKIPVDGLIEKMSVGSDGTVKMTSDIPVGKYYIKQIATSENYKLDDAKYEFTFDGKENTKIELNTDNTISYDRLTAEEKASTEASTSTAEVTDKAPTTGDVAPIAALATIMISAAGAMVVANKKRV